MRSKPATAAPLLKLIQLSKWHMFPQDLELCRSGCCVGALRDLVLHLHCLCILLPPSSQIRGSRPLEHLVLLAGRRPFQHGRRRARLLLCLLHHDILILVPAAATIASCVDLGQALPQRNALRVLHNQRGCLPKQRDGQAQKEEKQTQTSKTFSSTSRTKSKN